MGFVSSSAITFDNTGTFLSLDEVEPVESRPMTFGTGGVEEALMEPVESSPATDELIDVTRSGISGGARAVSELALFPVRAGGELAAASAGRVGAFEGYPGEIGGGQTDKQGQEWFSATFQGGIEHAKSVLLGGSEGARQVEEGVSLPFLPLSEAAQRVSSLAEEKTGDPLVGKIAEYGFLVGLFKAVHAGSRRLAERGVPKVEIPKEPAPIEPAEGPIAPPGEFIPKEEITSKPIRGKTKEIGKRSLLPSKLYLSESEWRMIQPFQNGLGGFFTRNEKALRWDKQVSELIERGKLREGANLNDLVGYIQSYQKAKKTGTTARQFEEGSAAEKKYEEAEQRYQEGKTTVDVNEADIKPGDTFTINGEKFKAEGYDEDGNLVVKDGKTYRLQPEDTIAVDKPKGPSPEKGLFVGEEDFRLISEESPEPMRPLERPTAEQPLLAGTEAAYRDVGMREQSLAAATDEAIGPTPAPAGLSIRLVDVAQPKAPYTPKDYAFDTPEIESRYNEAHGMKPVPLADRAREIVSRLKNKATREYEHLPRTAEFAPLRTDLLKLSKQKGGAADRTVRDMQGITSNLDANRFGLFERKVLLDDLAYEVGRDHKLPLGFTPDTLLAEKTKIDALTERDPIVSEALSRRSGFMESLRTEYVKAMKDAGADVAGRFDNEAYFRHQVLEYANLKGIVGTGKRLRTPTGRSFLRKRGGSELDINTNYLEAEYEVVTQMLHDIEVAKTIRNVDLRYNIIDRLKEQAEDSGKHWREIIPEGYTDWQPREGNLFYLADTIPAKLAEELHAGALKQIGLTEADLKTVLAVGRPRRAFVIKQEIADTLDNLTRKTPEGALLGLDRKALGYWKVWQLISPRRFAKHNFRNLTGDADAVFVGNPSTFRKVPQAIRELYQVFRHDKGMTPEMREWFRRGGFETTLQAQELGELNRFSQFSHIREPKQSIVSLPWRAFKKYWEIATIATNFRESVLRYAAYLDYLEQMSKSPDGMPKNFGASIPQEIRGIPEIRDRAFTMSNQLLGAYDQVSVMGQAIRAHIFPFWSWKEINFKRYIQFAKNAANDGTAVSLVARKIPGATARVGVFLIKATAFWSALQAWNNLRFPEEERQLDEFTKNRPHIIFGRDKNGKIMTFTNIGALGDVLAWFGLDAFPLQVSEWAHGKKTLREIAIDMAQAPVDVAVQGATPVAKIPAELLTKRQMFPDAFKPQTIRDRGFYLAKSFGLENEYAYATGLPTEGYAKSLKGMFFYTQDPAKNAFSDILSAKSRFMEKIGKGGEGSFISPKSNALYNYKLALKLKDRDAQKRYMLEYKKLGGTSQGMNASLKAMSPLYGLNKEEVKAFYATLDSEDRAKLLMAIRYYADVLEDRRGQ